MDSRLSAALDAWITSDDDQPEERTYRHWVPEDASPDDDIDWEWEEFRRQTPRKDQP